MVLLRCSIPSDDAHGRKSEMNVYGASKAGSSPNTARCFAHDSLESRRKPVGIRVAAVVMQRHAELAIDDERALRERAQLYRAVDQVVQVARGKRLRIGRGMQLRRDLPRRRARRT